MEKREELIKIASMLIIKVASGKEGDLFRFDCSDPINFGSKQYIVMTLQRGVIFNFCFE